jgi:hypothetical protein
MPAGYTFAAAPGPAFYTDTASLPADYCIANFDLKGHEVSFQRNRYNIFADDERLEFKLYGGPFAGATYEIRDYYGTVVRSGSAAVATLDLDPLPPGWYRLFLRRATPVANWGRAMGGAYFVVWRSNTPAGRFHANKVIGDSVTGNSEGGSDITLRSVLLFGPQRLQIIDSADPTMGDGGPDGPGAIAGVQADILVEQDWYLPYDPARGKQLLVNFSTYNNLTGENAGVTSVVEDTMTDVRNYEGRNEPDGQGAATWLPKQQAFHGAVKAGDATANVLGPCPTGLSGPSSSGVYRFLSQFFDLGGADYIDKLSYHDYNSIWGDLILARQVYDRLMELLDEHDIGDIEKWMTEVGAGAANFGVYQPRLQGRFVMMGLQIWEQYGIPKERVNYFYDASHGFYSVPTWYAHWEMTFYPPVALVRVWSEELWGKNFAERYGFGTIEDNWTIGSRFEAEDGSSVAAFSSCGRTDHTLTLGVSGNVSTLTVVSPFGVESTVAVANGRTTVDIDNGIPTYVRIPAGVSLRTVPRQYGPDLARGKTYTPAGSGAGASKVTDGVLRNWYFGQVGSSLYGASAPFTDDSTSFPQGHVLDFGGSTTVDTVVILCTPPYSFQGTLLDYDLQRWNGSTWVTIDTVTEDPLTLVEPTDQYLSASQVEGYFAERCVFVHEFSPVATTKLRLWVRDATRGAFPDALTSDARGEDWPHVVQIRAWQVYNRSGLPAPKYGARVA